MELGEGGGRGGRGGAKNLGLWRLRRFWVWGFGLSTLELHNVFGLAAVVSAG